MLSHRTSASNRWASTFENTNTRNAKNAKSQELYHNGREQKGGAAVVPPWGSSIRRPPKVCEACEITSPIAFRYARPITARESERPSSLCRPRFLIPSLCLSPGGGGTTGIPRQKSTISVLLGLLGRFFALPKRASKMTSKKHRKKCENRGF